MPSSGPALATALAERDPDRAVRLLCSRGPRDAARLLRKLGCAQGAHVQEETDPDDAVDVVDELAPHAAEAILIEMAPTEAEGIRELLAFPPESAAGRITKDVVTIGRGLTTDDLIQNGQVKRDEMRAPHELERPADRIAAQRQTRLPRARPKRPARSTPRRHPVPKGRTIADALDRTEHPCVVDLSRFRVNLY